MNGWMRLGNAVYNLDQVVVVEAATTKDPVQYQLLVTLSTGEQRAVNFDTAAERNQAALTILVRLGAWTVEEIALTGRWADGSRGAP